MEFTAQQIASLVNGEVEGDENVKISTFAKIEEGIQGALSFLSDLKYEKYIYETKSSIVLVDLNFHPSKSLKTTLIRVDNVRGAIAKLLVVYQQAIYKQRVGIHPTACIESSAKIGKDVYIGPHVYIGEDVVIGDGCQLYAGVVIEEKSEIGSDCIFYPNVSVYHHCKIGDDVILHSGCCIGSDGFGFSPNADGYDKIPQLGNVVIENQVEIGANSCIDRAVMGSTIIHQGVKLDNLIQIAHNCEIGSHTVMSAQVGIAGSVKVGEWCMFGGQVGIGGHCKIADRTTCGAQSGVPNSVKNTGETLLGSPAFNARDFAKSSAVFKKLPEILHELNDLKKKVTEINHQG